MNSPLKFQQLNSELFSWNILKKCPSRIFNAFAMGDDLFFGINTDLRIDPSSIPNPGVPVPEGIRL